MDLLVGNPRGIKSVQKYLPYVATGAVALARSLGSSFYQSARREAISQAADYGRAAVRRATGQASSFRFNNYRSSYKPRRYKKRYTKRRMMKRWRKKAPRKPKYGGWRKKSYY